MKMLKLFNISLVGTVLAKRPSQVKLILVKLLNLGVENMSFSSVSKVAVSLLFIMSTSWSAFAGSSFGGGDSADDHLALVVLAAQAVTLGGGAAELVSTQERKKLLAQVVM